MSDRVEHIQVHQRLLLIALAVGLLGYLLPWTVAPSAPMTLNAFDLAEWTSLHPAQRQTAPPLLAPLLLRAQLVFLTLAFAITTSGRTWRLFSVAAVVLLALAQLPPYEYVYDLANLNYRQQFFLALASLISGLLATVMGQRRIAWMLLLALAIVGTVSVVAGVAQAFELYRQLQQTTSVGLGPWILSSSYIAIATTSLLALRPGAATATN